MKSIKVLALAMLFLLTSMVPLITVEAANEERRDTDRVYISEKWRAGLGTGIGALNSIKSADIDADGEDGYCQRFNSNVFGTDVYYSFFNFTRSHRFRRVNFYVTTNL